MEPVLARILDANFNRAREGLRVAEEFARFAVEDARLAEQAKGFRHELADAARRLDPGGILLDSRDTAGDVGANRTHPSAVARGSAGEVATAAAKRVGEALRVLCEYAKVLDPTVAARLDDLRYRFYDWEKWLAGAADRRRFARVRLYLLLTGAMCRNGDWRATARAALDGGADAIQLREKSLDDGERLDRAAWLADACRAAGALCVINDRPDIARLARADGVHLGQADLSVAAARVILRPNQLVGVSTHDPEQLERAIALSSPSPLNGEGRGEGEPGPDKPTPHPRPLSLKGRGEDAPGPDYVALGPMFPTATKPDYAVAGPAYAKEAVARLDAAGIPHVAVGGITPDNLDELLVVGVRCVAVSSAILGAPDVAAACRAFGKKLR